jgi:hypothetical protein
MTNEGSTKQLENVFQQAVWEAAGNPTRLFKLGLRTVPTCLLERCKQNVKNAHNLKVRPASVFVIFSYRPAGEGAAAGGKLKHVRASLPCAKQRQPLGVWHNGRPAILCMLRNRKVPSLVAPLVCMVFPASQTGVSVKG